ncbi:uncharacterized protein LOC134670900 isoform X2 [Cydia fagiglandana]|uniref:uncharacterized protein LOC134670900 isoform X2 n=1 Tax=Cydia fagiglandana TaxID=1458189 RepID=UPI002FEE2735
MSILKVLPLMYLMVKASALRLTGFDPQHVKENNENCVCPADSPTIINSLDSDHSGVERLVVFVYKKPDTGEIISFIPQKEHQRKIPDFPDSYGHIHNIDQNPSIKEIFEISPSKDIREHKTHTEPIPQHDSNEGKENIIHSDDKIPKDFNEQHSNTDIKLPTWHVPLDRDEVKPDEDVDSYPLQISGENDDKNTDIMNFEIDMKIPKWQMQVNKNKVIPNADHKIPKIIIDDIGIKNSEQLPMQHDEIKVNPEDFISHPNDHINTEMMIDNIGMKIPEFPMQLDGIKVKPGHFIPYPNDQRNTGIMINNNGIKIPEWPMQLDEIKVKPGHFIPYPNDHKNTGIIDDIGIKLPEWQMQFDQNTVKPEQFIQYPNDHRNTGIMINNNGIEIPEWPMQLDQIKVKPAHFISYPNDHNNDIMIDNIGMKIPEFPMQLDGIKVNPEHFISYPNDYKNTGIIDDIGMKLPEWQMQFDQNTVKPEHFISYPQYITGEDDHKKPEIVVDTDLKIPKWQIQLDENNEPEPFISSPSDDKKAKIIIDETSINVPQLPTELDKNKINPEYIISQLVPGGNDQTKTEIVIDNIKPPTQDVLSELIPVPGEEYPNSQEKSHAFVQPLINNDLNLDTPSIDSTLIESLKPQNLFEESSPEHTLPGGIETIWHTEQKPLNEPKQSIQIKPPLTERFWFPDDKEVKTPTFQRLKVPRKDKYGRIIGWIYKTIKTYWEGGSRIPNKWEKYRINRYKPKFDYHYQYIEDPAFDRWLREQLRITTLNGNRIPTSTADITALDRAIRNVLLQNGWIVTGEGNLLDGSGRTSTLDNLKLRPILVGKTFSYDRFTKKNTHEYTASPKVPYLEGLLLTMIQPAKILGIVPLSISHKRHVEASVSGHSSKAKNGLRVLPIEELVSFRKDSEKSKKKKPQDSNKNKPKRPQVPSKDKSKDAALLRQAWSEIQLPQHASGSLTPLPQARGIVKHMDYGKYGTHRIIAPDRPEWRIIGGKSATSSGTPLEWKGRSGLYG